jgi:hypothetical protein
MSDEEVDMNSLPLEEFDNLISETLQRIQDPSLTHEEFIKVLRTVDHEQILFEEYDINDIRKVPASERVDFFQYFMTYIFVKMMEKEGAQVLLEAIKLGSLVENDSGRPWASLFGQLPKFDPGFLGLLQNCLWARVEPKVGMRELERERSIYEPFLQMVDEQGAPPETPPDGIRRHLDTPELIMVMMGVVQVHLSLIDMEQVRTTLVEWLESRGEPVEEEIMSAQFQELLMNMGPLLFFILSSSGIVQRLIDGLADHRPVLEKGPGGPTAFRVSNAGKDIIFL